MTTTTRTLPSRLGSGRARRVSASALLALAVAVGATLATASPAAAVGTSACSKNRYDLPSKITAASVNLRSGPGTSYSSKGLLAKNTKTIWRCSTPSEAHKWNWSYIKITSGTHKNTWGWVRADYNNLV
ncbi:SH3 domain-containing protein [Streptomyces californicus]|uniref:SH3 domain-containing protein n=1 Tax=Streptomyces californicus TaxID=67351 RepID=UPI0033D7E2C7